MKKAKTETFEERVQMLTGISHSLRISFAKMALKKQLAPYEMLLVAAHFSAILCLKASKHCGVELERIVDCFNNTMEECMEIEK